MKARDTRTIHLAIRVTSRDFLARYASLDKARHTAMRVARTAFADAGFPIWSSEITTADEGSVDTDTKPEVARHV